MCLRINAGHAVKGAGQLNAMGFGQGVFYWHGDLSCAGCSGPVPGAVQLYQEFAKGEARLPKR